MSQIASACRAGIFSLAICLLLVFSQSGQALAAAHTIAPGDTLWAISLRYGISVDRLKLANNLQGSLIFPGQVLYIPENTNQAVPGRTAGDPAAKNAPAVEVSRGGGGLNLSASEFDILARIITAEAENQDYRTQLAVGAVVLNRVESPNFPDTIRGVVYQVDQGGRYQFEPVLNGWINRPPSESAQKAAREALSGADPTGGALFFWESWVKNSYLNTRPKAQRLGEFTFTH